MLKAVLRASSSHTILPAVFHCQLVAPFPLSQAATPAHLAEFWVGASWRPTTATHTGQNCCGGTTQRGDANAAVTCMFALTQKRCAAVQCFHTENNTAPLKFAQALEEKNAHKSVKCCAVQAAIFTRHEFTPPLTWLAVSSLNLLRNHETVTSRTMRRGTVRNSGSAVLCGPNHRFRVARDRGNQYLATDLDYHRLHHWHHHWHHPF